MLLVLSGAHNTLNCGASLQSNLVGFFLLQHKIVHTLLTHFSDFPVLFISDMLNLVLTSLLQLNHIRAHAQTVLISLEIFEAFLL